MFLTNVRELKYINRNYIHVCFSWRIHCVVNSDNWTYYSHELICVKKRRLHYQFIVASSDFIMEKHASETDVPLHFLSEGWMKNAGRWMGKKRLWEWAGVYKPMDSSGTGRPNSLHSSIQQRTLPVWRHRPHFKNKHREVMSSDGRQRYGRDFTHTRAATEHCLSLLYISSTRSVCVPVFVGVREDSPLRVLHNLKQRGGRRGRWQSTRGGGGTV